MNRATVPRWLLALTGGALLSVLLAACGGASPTATSASATVPPSTPTRAPAPTSISPATATPTAPRPLPTATPTAIPPTPTPRGAEPKYGGNLNTGSQTVAVATGNFRLGLQPPGVALASFGARMAYNNLLVFDPYQGNKVLAGELAESWEVGRQGTQVTLKLRRGVQWHDRIPFTAKDVVYSLNLYLTPPQGYVTLGATTWLTSTVKAVSAQDDLTVLIDLNRPSASLVPRMTDYNVLMLPSHLSLDSLAGKPVGTGPFALDTWQQDAFEQWKRNPNYFLKDPAERSLPFLDGVRWFMFFDRALFIAAFRSGQIKYINNQQTSVVGAAKDQIEKAVPGAQFDELIAGFFGAIFKNVAPFNDPKVHEAVELWLDRKAFVDIGFQSVGCWYSTGTLCELQGGKWALPAQEILTRPGWRYVDAQGAPVDTWEKVQAKLKEVKKDPRDQQRAKDLLAEAGIKPGQVKVSVYIVNYEGPRGGPVFAGQMSELFGGTWEANVQPSLNQWTADMRSGNFRVGYAAHTGAGIDEPEVALGYITSTNPQYWGGWSPDAAVDKLMADQELELDFAKRRQIVLDLQRAVLKHPARVMANAGGGWGVSWPDVKDPPDAATAFSNIFSLHRVWLDR